MFLCFPGADINGQAGDGASPLYEASKNGHVSAVEALLALKADANRSTKSGLLPLHVAVQNNHKRSEPLRELNILNLFYLHSQRLFCLKELRGYYLQSVLVKKVFLVPKHTEELA